MADLKELMSGDALTLYAGAVLGFYGPRIVHTWGIAKIVEAVFKPKEGEARKGLSDPANWTEITDIAFGVATLAVVKNVTLKRGMLAGVGLSLFDHVLARFPDVKAKLPG